jgi:hypothetical protein
LPAPTGFHPLCSWLGSGSGSEPLHRTPQRGGPPIPRIPCNCLPRVRSMSPATIGAQEGNFPRLLQEITEACHDALIPGLLLYLPRRLPRPSIDTQLSFKSSDRSYMRVALYIRNKADRPFSVSFVTPSIVPRSPVSYTHAEPSSRPSALK